MKRHCKAWMMVGVVSLLVGCGQQQPWAVWQKYTAKTKSLQMPKTHHRFVGAEKNSDRHALTLHFGFDDSHLTGDDKEQLNSLVAALDKQSSGIVRLEGYTDERGSRPYNVALGWRRAQAVSAYLIQHGVDAKRLDLVSYGPEKPVSFGHDESAWQANRRVELSIGIYR